MKTIMTVILVLFSTLQVVAQHSISVSISGEYNSTSFVLRITNNNDYPIHIGSLGDRMDNGDVIGITASHYYARLLNPQTNELIQESRKLSLGRDSINRFSIRLSPGESYETPVLFNTNRWNTGLFDGMYGRFVVEMTVNLRYFHVSETIVRSFTSNLLLFDSRQ